MNAVNRLIESPWRGVIYAAGGTLLLSDLATTPGASNVLLAATVPYHNRAMIDLLGYEPESHCSSLTSRRLAMQAFLRAQDLADVSDQDHVYGLGITAALRSVRAKRGEHRAYVALQTPRKSLVWHVPLKKGGLSRLQEERELADLALHFLEFGLGLDETNSDFTPTIGADYHDSVPRLLGETPAFHGNAGLAVLPGAFNPMHEGHRRMREVAEERLNQHVVYELSIRNVDKPDLDFIDISQRIEQFEADEYVLTNQPTFIEKARLLFSTSGGTFVVGADTLLRIDHEQYYDSLEHRDAAIAELTMLGIRFLVFGRRHGSDFLTLEDLKVGSDLGALCEGISASEFQCDLSSTELRETCRKQA